MRELEAAGTARQKALHRKQGADDPLFGTSGAVLRAIARRVRRDQPLAEALWATGNFDARLLATRIACAAEMPGRALAEWIAAVKGPLLAEAVATVAAAHPSARALAAGWRAASEPWTGAVGWMVLTHAVPELDEAALAQALVEVERRAPTSGPEVRRAMYGLLVAIGARGDRVRTLAIETSRRVGRRADAVGRPDVADAEAGIMTAARAKVQAALAPRAGTRSGRPLPRDIARAAR